MGGKPFGEDLGNAIRLNGFGQIVIHPSLQAFFTIFGHCVGGHRHNGHMGNAGRLEGVRGQARQKGATSCS